MDIKNYTPFPNLKFSNLDAEGQEFGVFVVKVAWDILPDGTCRISEEQEPLTMVDSFRAELNASSVAFPADTAPYKPVTDIILNATAYAPAGKPNASWLAGFSVSDAFTGVEFVNKTLRISGPCQWERKLGAWHLGAPTPIEQLDIIYEYAFGGTFEIDEDTDDAPRIAAFEFNPLGRGFVVKSSLSKDHVIPAPQISHPNDDFSTLGETVSPAGFGATQAAWLPRRPLGGTYDAAWEADVWPNWAIDYDFAFHNAAPTDMQIKLGAEQTLVFSLTNLHPAKSEWIITLPPMPVAAMVLQNGLVLCTELRPDTIILDIDAATNGDLRIFSTARLVYRLDGTDAIALMPLDEAAKVSASLVPPPHPSDVVADGIWPQLDVNLDEIRKIGESLL